MGIWLDAFVSFLFLIDRLIVEQSLLFDGAGGVDTYISTNDIFFCLGGTKEVFLGTSHAKSCDGPEAGLRDSVLWWEMGKRDGLVPSKGRASFFCIPFDIYLQVPFSL